ncbi:hypothetical protein PhiH1_180 [Halobacterium phage phiH]|uniref:Uncharacterized protein n=1 Tax=Halobacterium phage phiH TaxID=169684 RepID=A0A3G1ZKU3_BPPHH|nr:hypothetical protein JR051_gp37 [Halobacterium phage phiH]AYM00283.1 hypothetical protein PhiH1_180 [Halobacterium phage phiH]
MQLLFTPDDSGTMRASGYATVPYSSDNEEESVVETTEEELSAVFQTAADSGVTGLPETGDSIDAAVEDPLAYHDFLVLEGEEVSFDDAYSRPSPSGDSQP